MDNRRRQDRKYLTFFSRVTDRRTGHMLGYLVDLATGGAMLVGNIALEPGVVYDVRIDLPDGFAARDVLELQAQAVWCKPDVDPEFYRIGLQLTDLQPEDLLLLERLLSNYGANE